MTPAIKTVPGQLYSIPRPPHSIAFPTTQPIVCFEHAPPRPSGDEPKNTLIFLGGLTDGLLTTPFVTPIAAALLSSWRLVEPVLGSNYRQFGFSSLDQDVAEIEVLVQFFRDLRQGGKIALLGHSTGSQMVMHYLLSEERKTGDGSEPRPKIDAGMMQGSASDREALEMFVSVEDMDAVVKQANEYMAKSKGNDVLPWKLTNNLFPGVPLSANRLLSLASPGPAHKGQDDYFSSDLSDERLFATFGRLGQTGTRICFLYGEEDQYVPGDIDKAALVEKWHRIAREGGAVVDQESGVVAGATHTLRGQTAPLELLVQRVVGLLGRL